jgi:hypothetical protein
MTRLVENVDQKLSEVGEALARQLSRRALIFTGIKGTAAAMAAISVGSLTQLKVAYAQNCSCDYTGTNGPCANCPSSGCPSGYSPCDNSHCSLCCVGGAYWIIPNCVCGACQGWYDCWDCWTGTCNQAHVCVCRSSCVCSGCCSPADVAAEYNRLYGQAAPGMKYTGPQS